VHFCRAGVLLPLAALLLMLLLLLLLLLQLRARRGLIAAGRRRGNFLCLPPLGALLVLRLPGPRRRRRCRCCAVGHRPWLLPRRAAAELALPAAAAAVRRLQPVVRADVERAKQQAGEHGHARVIVKRDARPLRQLEDADGH
jgi:hypothetical protein